MINEENPSNYVQEYVNRMKREHPQIARAARYLTRRLNRTVEEVCHFLYSSRMEDPNLVLVRVESMVSPTRKQNRRTRARLERRRILTDDEYNRIGLDVMRRAREIRD